MNKENVKNEQAPTPPEPDFEFLGVVNAKLTLDFNDLCPRLTVDFVDGVVYEEGIRLFHHLGLSDGRINVRRTR